MKASAMKTDLSSLSSSASVVDGKLILSLPDADIPVVWQMDLEQAKSSALEVREDKERGLYALVLKTQKGEAVEIAAYSSKETAVGGLMAVSRALESGHGKIRPSITPQNSNHIGTTPYAIAGNAGHIAANAQQTQSSGKGGALLAIALIAALVLVWIISIPTGKNSFMKPSLSNASGSSGATPEAGVPVSADDFLNRK